ncbi:MAG: helix-turn-helix transcriptional regulator, partial [Oscillospiraceae bacterium]|nr:helix-turn-helix transcriptional regulator [Oscillospiraceae bacterium]
MDELIKKRRKELGITLEEIGDYVGVSKTTVQRWENGNISNMRRDRIKK